MKKKTQLPKRSFRIEDADWNELTKLAFPESVGALLRKMVREFLKSNN